MNVKKHKKKDTRDEWEKEMDDYENEFKREDINFVRIYWPKK
jgi:hypothetical protein